MKANYLIFMAVTCFYLSIGATFGQEKEPTSNPLLGRWRVKFATANGKPYPLENCELIVRSDRILTKNEYGRYEEESPTYTLGPVAEIRRIDLFLGAGEKLTHMKGIFCINDRVFRLCYALPGKSRPDKFESRDGVLLIVLERIDARKDLTESQKSYGQ